MEQTEQLYHHIASQLKDAQESKMFGALCIKAPNGKAGIMYYKGLMVFKLQGEAMDEAMTLHGAQMFTPMEGRPMNGWVEVPALYQEKWLYFAEIAHEGAKLIEVKVKKKGK